ncbi:MAG: tyrosine-type recombinase/integrase [Gaiellaceae bacterium]
MARKVSGAVVEHTGRDGCTYRALRFTAYSKRRYVSLGAVSAGDAERELRHTLADIERGTWTEPRAIVAPADPEPVPTFHHLAEQWWLRNEPQLRPNTRVDYLTRLERHLLPFFADYRLDRITYDVVESYVAAKLADSKRAAADLAAWQQRLDAAQDAATGREVRRQRPARPLGARTINMTVTLLAAILEGAVERELIARNPAKGKDRRVREHEPRRSYLDTADQVAALLTAAGELDQRAREDRRHVERRAIVATLALAGLRIGEACALRWRDVDLAGGWLHVTDAKTDAGVRRVKIRGALRDELLAVRARHQAGPDEFVFATATGGAPSQDNIRSRVLAPAVALASRRLVERGLTPLPPRITPHSLRRTFASVLYALGEDPGIVMDEMGHTDPALALRVYRQAMRRDDGERERLRALVDGGISAVGGSRATERQSDAPDGEGSGIEKPRVSGAFRSAPGRI